jgi:hypothetical protein
MGNAGPVRPARLSVPARPAVLLTLIAFVVASVVLCSGSSNGAASAATGESASQRAIADAFAHLVPVPPVATGRAYLQGYDSVMRIDLLDAEDSLGSSGPVPKALSLTMGDARPVPAAASLATVPVSIAVRGATPPPSYTLHYDAVAVHQRGRWLVSWTTLCLLVEESGTVCPASPAGLQAGAVLPAPVGGPLAPRGLSSGIIDPGALAMGAGGSLLIADDARNQILRWQAGVLSVVAGNTVAGYAGDGGPANQAELDDPGELAVGPNGTVYFVDTGNNRVRAIAVDGVITTVAGDGTAGNTGDGGPATRAEISPSGLAVGPSGLIWVASGSSIRVIDPAGTISTVVNGGPPAGVDVPLGGSPTAFFPASMALNGQGDLDVFSSSPKLLLQVSPNGAVTEVASDYATALATAPDGTVLVAEHGTGIARVAGATESTLFDFSHARVPGLTYSLAPHGVAESADGTVYTDTDPGDGFTDQSGLYSVTPQGVVRPLPVSTPLAATLPGPGAPGFPLATFPSAVAAARPGRVLTRCPSPRGLEPFTADAVAVAAARRLAAQWGTTFSSDLAHSDRSWWPSLVTGYPWFGQQGTGTVLTAQPAGRDLDATAVAAACGASLVRQSLVVVIGPSAYSSTVARLYLLNRSGTPLVYFEDY